MQSINRHRFIARFLTLFLSVAAIATLLLASIYYFHYVKSRRDKVLAQAHVVEHLTEQLVHLKFRSIISDLNILANHRQFAEILNGRISPSDFTDELLTFSRYKGIYDQIRLLKLSGMEVLRIDLRGDSPVLVPGDELQDKSPRYYFQNMQRLPGGSLYMSRFDLNIEHGEIERPLKPMIRFGMPLTDTEGHRVGYLVLNYLGRDLFDALNHITNYMPGKTMLLNQEGYWLRGPSADKEWGFMRPDGSDNTLQNEDPELWQRILDEGEGMVTSDGAIISYLTVYPSDEGMVTSSFLESANEGSEPPHRLFWVLLFRTSYDEVLVGHEELLIMLAVADALLLLVLGGICWYLALAVERRKLAQDELHAWNEDLELTVAQRTRDLTEANQNLEQAIEDQQRTLSEKKHAEEKLRQIQKMEAIGTLAGGVAHDFNNILVPIMGYGEMVLEQLGPESPLEGSMKGILRAAERAKDLVQQILTFSRRSESEMVALEVPIIVKETVQFLRATIPSSIRIQTNIDPNTRKVMADPTEVHQLVMNLATNAYHAMRDTGGTLTIETHNVTLSDGHALVTEGELEAGEYLQLIVEDTGGGLDPVIKDRIFEPYFTTKAQGEGTGLGLSVVHAVVQNMNGHIALESEQGEGVRFSIYLSTTEEVSDDSAAVIDRATVQGEGESVLLVDDQQALLDVQTEAIEQFGYQVTAYNKSPEAMRAFEENPVQFDVIVTDMTMPDLSGLELIEKIRAIRPGFPAVLCSGYSEQIHESGLQEMGIEFQLKPVKLRLLALVIRNALNRKADAE